MEHVVGDWNSLIGEEFNKPYMHELQNAITLHKQNPFGSFNSYDDYFEVFKKTPMMNTKVLYIVDTPQFNADILYKIEADMYGLNLDMTSHTDFDWLLEQGVMIFPRHLSWNGDGKGHREWEVFTDEVIRLLTFHHGELVICTKDRDLEIMMKELRPYIYTIGQGAGCFEEIDRYCKSHFKEVSWCPVKY